MVSINIISILNNLTIGKKITLEKLNDKFFQILQL